MKPLVQCCMALALAAAARAADIIATNDRAGSESTTRLVTGEHGKLLPAGRGFVAVGVFTITDAQLAVANAAPSSTNAALVKSSFRQFGSAARAGLDEFGGLFEISAEAALVQGAFSFAGLPVYLVIGDGDALRASSALLVYKSEVNFPDSEELPVATLTLAGADPAQLLIGRFGMFTATLPGVVTDQPAYTLTGFQKPAYADWAALFFPPGTPPEDTAQNADPDGDGLTNQDEYNACTDPMRPEDTDGDGGVDGDETAFGHDPDNAADAIRFGDRLASWTLNGPGDDVAGCLDLLPENGTPGIVPARAGTGVELTPPMNMRTHPVATRMTAPIGSGFSVAAWVRPCVVNNSGGEFIPMLAGGSAWSLGRRVTGSAAPPRLRVGDIQLTGAYDTLAPAGPLLPDGNLHHLAVSVFPGRRMEIWLDGQKLAAGPQAAPLADTGSPVSLLTPVLAGAVVSGSLIADELFFWNRPLSLHDLGPILRRSTAFLDQHRRADQPGFACRRHVWGTDPATGRRTLLLVGENVAGATAYQLQTSTTLGSWQNAGSAQPHPAFTFDLGNGALPGARQMFRITLPP